MAAGCYPPWSWAPIGVAQVTVFPGWRPYMPWLRVGVFRSPHAGRIATMAFKHRKRSIVVAMH